MKFLLLNVLPEFFIFGQQFYNMDRDILNYNPVVTTKIQQKNLERHYQRLNSIKATGSSRNQISSLHKPNRRGVLKQEHRKTAIEKDNVMLFNKMMRIMKRPDPCNQPQSQTRYSNRPVAELEKIEQQNRTMYERIEKQKPTINSRKMQEDRKKNENILKFLGKYSQHSLQNMQPGSLKSSQARVNPSKTQYSRSNHYLQPSEINTAVEMRTKARYNPYDLEEEVDEDDIKMHLDIASRNHKVYSSTHSQVPRNKASVFESTGPSRGDIRTAPHSAKDIILFKSKCHLGGQILEVSIVRSHHTYQIKARQPGNAMDQSLNMILSEEQGNQLLEISNYNYKQIIDRLSIRGGQLTFEEEGEEEQEEYIHQSEQIQSQQPEIKPYNKPNIHYFNPSHISEQNEEESFRPAESFNQASPPKYKQRMDSLGEEEPDEFQEQPFEESFPQVERSEAKNESNLSPILESRDNEESPEKGESLQFSISKKAPIELTFNPCKVSSYEEALEEEIL